MLAAAPSARQLSDDPQAAMKAAIAQMMPSKEEVEKVRHEANPRATCLEP